MSRARHRRLMAEINVVPYIDVMLVLLIVFMMTASYIVTPAIKVDLPKAASAEATVVSQLALVITREGDVFLNNAKVTEEDIRAFIKAEKKKSPDLEAILAADGSVPHRRMVALIDLIKSEGIVKFAINTQADFTSASAGGSEEEGEAEQ